MNKPLRVGLIGAGMVSRHHLIASADIAGVSVFASFAAHGHPAAQVDRLEILGDKGAIKLDGPSLTCSGISADARTYDLAAEYQGSYNRTIAHFVKSLRDDT